MTNCSQVFRDNSWRKPHCLCNASHLSNHCHNVVEFVNSRTDSLQSEEQNSVLVKITLLISFKEKTSSIVHTTPAAPAVTAIGAVTELNPDEHITGMLTAREMEYAAASVGVACNYKHYVI